MIRRLKIYGDPILSLKAEPVEKIDSFIKNLVNDMFETMYHYNGIGLAAIQTGNPVQVFVADILREQDSRKVFINAKVTDSEGEIIGEEGCLSVPNVFGNVKRSGKIWVNYLNLKGKEIREECDELLARVIQHEIDHLDGILFVDRLNPAERELLRKDLQRLKKERKKIARGEPEIFFDYRKKL